MTLVETVRHTGRRANSSFLLYTVIVKSYNREGSFVEHARNCLTYMGQAVFCHRPYSHLITPLSIYINFVKRVLSSIKYGHKHIRSAILTPNSSFGFFKIALFYLTSGGRRKLSLINIAMLSSIS